MTEKYMIKMKKQLAYLLLAATSLCLWSCSNDDGEAPQLKGTETQVPITITFGGAWDTDNATSRVAPPEQGDGLVNSSIDEIKDIDRVRIITFRRKDASVAGTANGQFVYDPTNDVITTCQQEDKDERKEAHAQLVKAYGYEYRVVAIAYPSEQEGWFDLNTNLDGLTFDDFEMTIKGQETRAAGAFNRDEGINIKFHKDIFNVMFTPHFFYGYCHLENSDEPIIKFGETEEEKAAPLTGILYRAVAKVEVNLEVQKYNFYGVDYNIEHAALLMDNVYAKTSMSSYDDFLSPENPYNDKKEYTVVDYEENVPNKGETMTMTVYVLPTKTKLGLAVYYTVALPHTRAAWFSAKDLSYADGATGVISPDVHGDEFYFRRNHKYVISGDTNDANFDN